MWLRLIRQQLRASWTRSKSGSQAADADWRCVSDRLDPDDLDPDRESLKDASDEPQLRLLYSTGLRVCIHQANLISQYAVWKRVLVSITPNERYTLTLHSFYILNTVVWPHCMTSDSGNGKLNYNERAIPLC